MLDSYRVKKLNSMLLDVKRKLLFSLFFFFFFSFFKFYFSEGCVVYVHF